VSSIVSKGPELFVSGLAAGCEADKFAMQDLNSSRSSAGV